MKKWLLPLAACSVMISTPALAVDQYIWKPDADKRFKVKDLNHDGTITKEEFLHPHNSNFDRIDSDNNNQISMEEMRRHLQDKKPEHVTDQQWSTKSDRHFGRKDLNKDNVIAKDEYMSRYEDRFRGFDRDNNESISEEEMRIYWEAERAQLEKSKEGDDN